MRSVRVRCRCSRVGSTAATGGAGIAQRALSCCDRMSQLLPSGIAPMVLDVGSNAGGSLLQKVWEAPAAKWRAPPPGSCPGCSES
eukprot:9152040-Pyramimonas_sp.AAC.1